jgi:hypothetical protein
MVRSSQNEKLNVNFKINFCQKNKMMKNKEDERKSKRENEWKV